MVLRTHWLTLVLMTGCDMDVNAVPLTSSDAPVDSGARAATVPDAPPTSTTSVTPTSIPPVVSKCARFKPGHYVLVADDATRGVDGQATLKSVLAKDVHSFTGVAYMITWGMLEPSRDVYDFSRVDAALAQLKAKGMSLLLKFEDRTFWTGCSSAFTPSYVAKDPAISDTHYCVAKVWDPTTVDDEIRVLQKIVTHYANEPAFLGVDIEETSIAAVTVQNDKSLYAKYYDQLKRVHEAVNAVAPGMIVNQEFNWPVNKDIRPFYGIVQNLVDKGITGSVSWPDSIPSAASSWSWYQLGRDYHDKLLVMPYAQGASIDATSATANAIYDFLVDEVRAHAVIWSVWHRDNSNYLSDVVIPTVNGHGGAIKNTTCPFK